VGTDIDRRQILSVKPLRQSKYRNKTCVHFSPKIFIEVVATTTLLGPKSATHDEITVVFAVDILVSWQSQGMTTSLNTFASDTYSQFGEGGIISEILDRISQVTSLSTLCVEFAAWDGVYLPNTCRLILERGFSAVLIEGMTSRVRDLDVLPTEVVCVA
jgi:hypothetical protein